MSQYRIEASTGQYIGERTEQQDRAAIFGSPRAPGYMMAVLADGMGGLTGGALAAEQVIRTAKHNFEFFTPGDDIEKLLNTIAHEAHTIINLSAISAEKQPHSTMVVLILTPEKTAWWGHVGDSRLYRFEGHSFVERTTDHSFAEKLVSSGKMSRDEAQNHKMANLLVNVLGTTTSELFVTVRRYDSFRPGDAFLLCSDGLWNYFDEEELGAVVAQYAPRQAAEMLMEEAKRRGEGTNADNCTFAIVKVLEAATKEDSQSKPRPVQQQATTGLAGSGRQPNTIAPRTLMPEPPGNGKANDKDGDPEPSESAGGLSRFLTTIMRRRD